MPTPEVVTERLILRGYRIEDFEPIAAMYAMPEVYRYIGQKPMPRDAVWSRVLRAAGHWELMKFGFWVVTAKEDGRFLGEGGLADLHPDAKPPLSHVPEIGCAFVPEAYGKGIASEVTLATCAWADANLKSTKIVAMIEDGHVASDKLAIKCGFVRERVISYRGTPTGMWLRTPKAAP